MSGAGLKPTFVILLLLVGAIGVGSGYLWMARDFRAPSATLPADTTATVLAQPLPLPPFTLTDHHGRPFDRESLRGQWTYLFFGYTHCPDVCPTTLMTLGQVDRLLQEASVTPRPRVVFVAVDPERDTPQVLAQYVAHFNADFLGVTGTEALLQALTQPLGILFMRSPGDAPEGGYLIDHSASLLLIDPGARLRALSSPPHDAAAIAADYRKIVSRYGDTE